MDESVDLYELIRLRYERRATNIKSNRAAAEWPAVFGAPMLASVAVYRFRHCAHVFEIDGPSPRPKSPQSVAQMKAERWL